MNHDTTTDRIGSRPLSEARPESSHETRLQIGAIVTSETVSNNTAGLIVDIVPKRAGEYAVAVSGPNSVTTLADRHADAGVDPEEIVFQILFVPLLERNFPDWQTDPRPAIGAYHSGSFCSVAKAIPESLLTLVDDPDREEST